VDGEVRYGCDTYFAVDSAYAKQWIKVDDSTALISKLQQEFETIGYHPDVVITGGEPLMYHSDATFYEVIRWLLEQKIRVTFETNGTIEIDFEKYPAYRECIFSLSLKLANSGEPVEKRIIPQALENLQSYSKETFLKFTIDKELVETTAIDEINVVRRILPKLEVFCMPVGESRDTIWQNDRAVFEFCMKHNFRYSDRLHIRVFDTTQGV